MVQHIDRGTHEPYDKELHGQAQEDHSELLEGYCGLDGAVVKSIDEINSFDKLKAVADSIQENKDILLSSIER